MNYSGGHSVPSPGGNMDNPWIDIGLTIVLGAIKDSFKNPKRKAELKAVLIKIRDKINLLYPEEV